MNSHGVKPPADRSQHGVALVVVLWTITLLSLLAAGFASVTKVESRLIRNTLDTTRAYYLAEAGIYNAVYALLHVGSKKFPTDGSISELLLEDEKLRISITDESGKIDLNAAPAVQLSGLLRTTETEDARLQALVDAILDWRDGDALRRVNGAEDDEYLDSGLDYGAKDAPFDGIEELQLVMGMTPQLYNRLESAVTVYSGRSTVNTLVANRQVLLALLDHDEAADAFIAKRQSENKQAGYLTPAGTSTFTIQVEAMLASGARGSCSAIVRIRNNSKQNFTVLEWKSGSVKLF